MKRRDFFSRLAAVAVAAPMAKQIAAEPVAAPLHEFPPLNYIDFPKHSGDITAIVPYYDKVFVFTERGMYEMTGAHGKMISEGGRFRAEHIDGDHTRVMLRRLID